MKKLLGAVLGVLLGALLAWGAGHLATALYAPHAPEPPALDDVAAVAFLVALAVACPLLGWAGWKVAGSDRG
ncbi:hypothetical protein M8A51_12995 [Schlegelella sp. S2-27]|uniref:Uncharacterized protein n=1 Tax=Caldimonas mangrovi TaxID=2944811 RepID=A0ABT0YPW0_9BURK|nr:hypothetical protein [Caldimonas mangrovi]MCM5680444.1 hypothetical protein [Caldimonas mangrovi]